MSRAVGMVLLLIAAAGLLFVWIPSAADRFVHLVGVGRGADLVLYVYCMVSFMLILNIYLKMQVQQELATRLARQIALNSPLLPDGHDTSVTGTSP